MESSGTISLRDDVIRYECGGDSWALPIDRLVVFGESTTDHGPFLDDYWFCFATGPVLWSEASFYAGGRDEFLDAMSERLGAPMILKLQSSTNYASRVVWPPLLVDRPMFTYTNQWPSNTLLRLASKMLGGPSQNVQTYSDEVAQFLQTPTS